MSSPLTYTEEQAAAITTRGVSIALDAGAGCGKTFVLTERFLSHLAPMQQPDESPLELHELVAITFTDAAAREMRQRVRAKCLERLRDAQAEDADYWLRLLRSLDAARVSTIHAFCQTLVRAHALELGLDPSFHVLDQAAADVLLSEATDESLRLALDQRSEDIMLLAAEFGLTGLKSRLAPLLELVGQASLAYWESNPAEETVEAWRTFFESEVKGLQRRQLVESPEIETIRSMIPESTGGADTRAKLWELDELLQAIQQGKANQAQLDRTLELAKIQGVCGKKADWPSPEAKKLYGDACTKLRDAIKKQAVWEENDIQLEAARLGQRLARVAGLVAGAYESAKRSAAAIDFNDLLALARRLLTQEEFHDVQRRVRGSVKLLLVDEFQDTDQQQVDIVTQLVGEPLANGGLFFVGDFKQSIYRFRGAEPEVFRKLQDLLPAEGRLPLSQNFRSQPAVLEFVNALFGPLFGRGYLPLRPARPQVGPTPAVEFLWTPIEPKTKVEQSRQAEARRIASRIKELLEDPTERVAERVEGQWRARPVKPGDIAILFRALGDVQHYEQALRDAGIDHHLIGGHAFYSQQEVYDLLNLLRSVTSSCDEVSLAGVLRSPFFSLLDETLLWLTRAGGSLNAGLMRRGPIDQLDAEQQRRVDATREVIVELRGMKGAANTAEVIRLALERTGYDAALLSEFLGERKLANLEKIVEQARVADQNRPGDIDAFVRQLTEFIARQPKEALAATTSEDEDVVRLMTVHHSKGLEFPVVIVADLSRPSQNDNSVAAFHLRLGPLVKPASADSNSLIGLKLYKLAQSQAEEDERVRMFYVACTRAADLLILSAAVEDIEKPKGEWLKSLAKCFDLQTGATIEQSDRGLLVEVVPEGEDLPAKTQAGGRGVDLPKLITGVLSSSAERRPSQEWIKPIAINPLDLRRFSVSRLTGRLHYRADQRGVPAELFAKPKEKIDPLGLGTLVHAVMERLDFANPRNVHDWCEALAPQHLVRNVEAAATEAEEMIDRFLTSERRRSLASSPQVKKEVEFLMAWPLGSATSTAQLQGYIDCLYLDAQRLWRLLDYKTNQVTPAQVPAAGETYRLQMSVYALAVEQSLGLRPASLDVHFLRPGVEASFAWDDEARAAAIDAIDEAILQVRDSANHHA